MPVNRDVLLTGATGFLGRGAIPDDESTLERVFRNQVRDYWPYLHGDPAFDRRNTRTALPSLPPPCIDQAMLVRLIRFARGDRWGRRRRRQETQTDLDCADYVERFLPAAARRSLLARVAGLSVTVGLEVSGPGGGRWSCCWDQGDLTHVSRGPADGAAVTYRTDAPTFAAVVQGRTTAQQAFFTHRIGIKGDVEKALKLAMLFEHFVQDNPYRPRDAQEAMDADACTR